MSIHACTHAYEHMSDMSMHMAKQVTAAAYSCATTGMIEGWKPGSGAGTPDRGVAAGPEVAPTAPAVVNQATPSTPATANSASFVASGVLVPLLVLALGAMNVF